MTRRRISWQPPPPAAPGTRLRRDPRAELEGRPAPASGSSVLGEPIAPAGRVRRDPRAERQERGQSGAPAVHATEPATPALAERITVVADPACWVLAVPDFGDGRLGSHDRDVLGAARLIADRLGGATVVLAPRACHEDFAALGTDRVQPVTLPATYDPEWQARAVLAAIDKLKPVHIVFPENLTGGGDVGRRVAAELALPIAPRVVRLTGAEALSAAGSNEYIRPWPRLLFIAAEAVEPPNGARREARVLEELAPITAPAGFEDHGLVAIDPASVPLTEADFIVSAGNGVTDFAAFHAVAATLGAAEGASRVVCDAGHLPRARQVGASGTLVEPRCYLAFGIAGAVQHLQGIAHCERVIAVNTDLHSDMVKRADLAIIADAQAVMPALIRLAERRRSSRAV